MTLFLLALGLSMDAFAAAIGQGAAARPQPGPAGALLVGLAFGAAQALMPLLGWALGAAFESAIASVDHWIAFALLVLIGAHMVHAAWTGADCPSPDRPEPDRPAARRAAAHRAALRLPMALLAGWPLLTASLATSVDAAAAGVTLALLDQPMAAACATIGLVTLVMSTTGVLIGKMAGALAGRRAEALGGVVLIGIGTKILVEHLFFGA